MAGLPEMGDIEDTGKIRAEVAKGPSSDPGRDVAALTAAFIMHESADSRRWRWTMWAFGLLLTAALAVCGFALNAAAESGADRATMQDMHDRMVRIESLLMSRDGH